MTKDKLKKHFGKLIVLEGIDACGKETQTNLLVKNLKKQVKRQLNSLIFNFSPLCKYNLQGGNNWHCQNRSCNTQKLSTNK